MNSIIADNILIKELLINNQEVVVNNISFFIATTQPVDNETIYFNKIYDSTSQPVTSDFGDIKIFKPSKYFLIFRIEKIDFIQHNGSLYLDFMINDNIMKSIYISGPGNINPSYGYENIYFSDTIYTVDTFSFKFREVNNILNIISNMMIFTNPIQTNV